MKKKRTENSHIANINISNSEAIVSRIIKVGLDQADITGVSEGTVAGRCNSNATTPVSRNGEDGSGSRGDGSIGYVSARGSGGVGIAGVRG